MRYTPGQIREMLELPEQTFRHWRDALPPVSGRRGHTPSFTAGDVLALAVVKALVHDLGVRVGALTEGAPQLFEICNSRSWLSLEDAVLALQSAPDPSWYLDEGMRDRERPTIVVPCSPIVERLRARLLAERELEAQGRLLFPPTAVSSDGGGRRR